MFTIGAQGVTFLLQISSISVLARLISPEDYGMIGMLSSVLALLQVFRDFGLTIAIVQAPSIDQSQLNALFRVSILLGIAMLLLVSLTGFGLTWFIDDSRFIRVAPWYGVMFLFSALGSVPLGILRRSLQFGRIALLDASSFVLGVVSGIAVGYIGGGYMALVAMSGVNTISNVSLAWIASGWKPTRESASLKSTATLLKFGGTFTLGEVCNYLSRNLDNLLIGKIWGLNQLGFYTRGYALMEAPMSHIMGPIGTVLIPIFSRLQENVEQYKKWVLRIFDVFMFGSAPLAAFLMVASDEIVPLLLGDGWQLTIRIFFWLGISLYGKPVASLTYWVFVSSGNIRELLRWTMANTILVVIAIVASVYWGPVAVAATYSVTGCLIRTPMAFYYAARTGRVEFSILTIRYLIGLGWFAACFAGLWGVDHVATHFEYMPWASLLLLGASTVIPLLLITFFTTKGKTLLWEIRQYTKVTSSAI
jgi:PST family polysaccharide transporter